ncbi:MAG TPA: HAD-IIB family hydrolase [Thermodesulfobacteriota bacterium]|nr:HAD-IIB family hydrolase [Thermodesulfobacteriota bacterium]
MMTTPKLVIFTDLDGTLLDRNTYSFESALPALHLIRQKNIPLILTSSKTRTEIEFCQAQLQINHPFISENGGAAFIPKGYFSYPFPYSSDSGKYLILEFGTCYPKIVEVLNLIKKETDIPIKGFSDLTEEELVSLCGLSIKEAKFSKRREYDEPFLIEAGEKEVEIVKTKIKEKGMTYAWGGRFHHILGKNDKGKAVKMIKKLFENEYFSITTLGIGDSSNDLPMLLAVDHPIFLKEKESLLPQIPSTVQNLVIFEGAGPQAWNRAIQSFMAEFALLPAITKLKEP